MANDAALRANFDNFLYDMQGTLQRLFPRDNVLLAELSGVIQSSPADPVVDYAQNEGRFTRAMDGNREHFDGEQVRFPVMVSGLQGASAASENSTWNEPIPIENAKATAKLGQVIVPFALSLALERDSRSGSHSAMSAVQMYTEEAYAASALIEDIMLHGDGDALLAKNTAGDATGLVMTIGTTADFDKIVPGSVFDVLTVADGSDPGQGLRRKVESTDKAAGTVTFSTTQQASDGGVGNIALAAAAAGTWGIYLPGSYGEAIQGLGQTVTAAGTAFEGIDVANVARWTAVTKDAGATGLSNTILDECEYLSRGQGCGYHDFGIAHPAVVDKYKSSLTPTVYYQPQEATLRSGFSGITYQGGDRPYPIVKAMNAPREKCRLIRKRGLRLYGDGVGPSFIDDDGSIFRFFTRKTVKEADLLDRIQLAVSKPSDIVEISNLTELY